jgi:hypothetical protein
VFLLRGLVDDERNERNGDDCITVLFDGKGRGTAASKPFVYNGVFGEFVESVRHVMHPRFWVLELNHIKLIFNCLQESSIACLLQLDLRSWGGDYLIATYILLYTKIHFSSKNM